MNCFIDTDGEMTFENKERLKFVMHFIKKGATNQVKTNSDGKFVREDAEISFNEIWLPCAQSRQAEIDALQKRIDEAVEYLKDGLNDFYIDYVCEETLKILKGETNE